MAEWEGFLEGIALPEGIEERARLRFDRRAIFFRTRPLEVARLNVEVVGLLKEGRGLEALELARRVLSFSPDDLTTQLRFLSVLSFLGRWEEAKGFAKVAMSKEGMNSVTKARFETLVSDAAWRAGQVTDSLAGYRRVLKAPVDQVTRRLQL